MVYFACILILSVFLIAMDTFKCDKNIKQLFYGVAVIIFIALATFRPFDFQDTRAYSEFYISQLNEPLFAPNNSIFEWGFVILTRLCTLISDNYQMLFFAQALIINLIAVCVLNKFDSKLLLYACFMSFYGIYTTFIIMRSGLAIAFFVLGVMKFEKKWIMRILCFVLSILFHMSAIVMILIYLFAYILRKINVKTEFACCIFVVLLICFASGASKELMILVRTFLSELPHRTYFIAKAIEYLNHNISMFEFGLSFRYLMNAIFYVMSLFAINKFKIELSDTLRANLIYIFIGLCVESLLGNMRLIGRLTDFCNILNICSVGILVKNNMSQIKAYEVVETKNYTYIGKIRSLQFYSFALAIIFVCLNLIFMYRIVY